LHLAAAAFPGQLWRVVPAGGGVVDRSLGVCRRAVVCGYGFAWVGHFFFEKNRPATFRHPLYSLMGDWVMFVDILRGRVRI